MSSFFKNIFSKRYNALKLKEQGTIIGGFMVYLFHFMKPIREKLLKKYIRNTDFSTINYKGLEMQI